MKISLGIYFTFGVLYWFIYTGDTKNHEISFFRFHLIDMGYNMAKGIFWPLSLSYDYLKNNGPFNTVYIYSDKNENINIRTAIDFYDGNNRILIYNNETLVIGALLQNDKLKECSQPNNIQCSYDMIEKIESILKFHKTGQLEGLQYIGYLDGLYVVKNMKIN